jgi:hypothetical protein
LVQRHGPLPSQLRLEFEDSVQKPWQHGVVRLQGADSGAQVGASQKQAAPPVSGQATRLPELSVA